MSKAKMPMKGMPVSQAKAKIIMHEGEIRGHPLTPKQKGMFGAIAGGNSKKAPKKGK